MRSRKLVKFVSGFMAAFICLIGLSIPAAAIVDVSRGPGDDYNVTAMSSFPFTLGFTFRSSSNSDYNYTCCTEIGGFGQEWQRTQSGTDSFIYTFDEDGYEAVTRNLHYTFNGDVVWSSSDYDGYRWGYQSISLALTTNNSDQACETMVVRADDIVFNTWPIYYFLYQHGEVYDLADMAYLGVPVFSAPYHDTEFEKYAGTVSISYTVTDQYGYSRDVSFVQEYDSSVEPTCLMLDVDDLMTYYRPLDAQYSSKVLISNYYAFWDVDYYTREVQQAEISLSDADGNPFDIIVIPNSMIGQTWSSFIGDTFSSGLGDTYVLSTFSENSGQIVFKNASDTSMEYRILNGINYATANETIEPGEYGTVFYSAEDALAGTWVFNDTIYGTLTRAMWNESVGLNFSVLAEGGEYLFSRMAMSTSGPFLFYGTSMVFNGGYWVNDDDGYKTVYISSLLSEVVGLSGNSIWSTPEDFLTWLKANATKQSTASTAAVATVSESDPVNVAATVFDVTYTDWTVTETANKNKVVVWYPLYDTSNGNTAAVLLSYPNFPNYLAGTSELPNGDDVPGVNTDFTSWLAVATGGFLNTELWPNFSIGGMLAILVSFSVVMIFLKVFAGG